MNKTNPSNNPLFSRYPDESTLSETHRMLEGFISTDGSPLALPAETLTVSDFIRSTTKLPYQTPDNVVLNLTALLGVFLLGGLTLGITLTQLSFSLERLTAESLYPIDFVPLTSSQLHSAQR